MKNKSKFAIIAAISVAVAIMVTWILIKPVKVNGRSMEPTFTDGELIMVERTCLTSVDLYDVVVVKSASTDNLYYIKRIEGLPGDTVQIINGVLIRNSEVVEDGLPIMEYAGMFSTAYTLGENEYLVLGDNRNDSRDGRAIGPVRLEEIKYVAFNSRQ